MGGENKEKSFFLSNWLHKRSQYASVAHSIARNVRDNRKKSIKDFSDFYFSHILLHFTSPFDLAISFYFCVVHCWNTYMWIDAEKCMFNVRCEIDRKKTDPFMWRKKTVKRSTTHPPILFYLRHWCGDNIIRGAIELNPFNMWPCVCVWTTHRIERKNNRMEINGKGMNFTITWVQIVFCYLQSFCQCHY